MTIQGAMKELVNLLNADDIPIYYKGGIKKVIETIDDYIDGKDDYIKRKDEPQNGYQTFSGTSVYVSRFEDEPQTETEIAKAIVHEMIDGAVIAEDAYPDLRQRMHEAVERLDEYYPSEDERSE